MAGATGATALARRIVGMAESRAEVVQHEEGLDDMFKYYLKFDVPRYSDAPNKMKRKDAANKRVIVITENGYEVKSYQELGLVYLRSTLSDDLTVRDETGVINTLCMYGYSLCCSEPFRTGQVPELLFVLQVPRRFAMQHKHAM
eukprot:TRINITY_DN25907_c0_g1_i2.p1 TRINITY_DN25907_c0_g1~~TRINITY_DN25907_c0_g1_i2.p1  ORF type:complete len:165 (+),score=13.81 TRINITY_DN25907_c0_g1_i2:65-496(+)